MGLLYLYSPLFFSFYLLKFFPTFHFPLFVFFFFNSFFVSLSLNCLERGAKIYVYFGLSFIAWLSFQSLFFFFIIIFLWFYLFIFWKIFNIKTISERVKNILLIIKDSGNKGGKIKAYMEPFFATSIQWPYIYNKKAGNWTPSVSQIVN
jgi:hypothetical protein